MANYVDLGYDGNLSMAEIIAAAKGNENGSQKPAENEKEGE